MNLYLIRHAEAYDQSPMQSDEYRTITPKGRKVTRKVAKKLKKELKYLDKIFTSPLTRAVQTAEIIATRLKFEKDVEIGEVLNGKSELYKITGFIKENSGLSSIALVGHEPGMSSLVRSLSNRKAFGDFSKSGVCLIDFDPDSEEGKFIWYFNPKKSEYEK